jgi:hypothetical protein
MKHKWDKEIRAYLDGKEVEMYYPDVKEWKQVLCMSKFDCKFDIRIKPEPQTDLIVLLRVEITLMQKYLEEQKLIGHFVNWRMKNET